LKSYYQTANQYRDVLYQHDAAFFGGYVSAVNSIRRIEDRLLDVGCGNGESTRLLSVGAGGISVGVDVSALFLKDSDRTKSANYVAADACTLPFESQSFDLVTSRDLLEHVEDVESVLDEMVRVLAPGGRILVWCPNLLSPFRPARYLWLIVSRGQRTFVWGESAWHCLASIITNTVAISIRAVRSGPRFSYREPDPEMLRVISGGDVDAVYLANPVDVTRYFAREGFRVFPVSSSTLGERGPRAFIRRFLSIFVSPLVLVAVRRTSTTSARFTPR
jgi:SAM-dependent methyltransferase